MTKRLLPWPLTSLSLLVLWLLLNQSLWLGHILLGIALAIAIPWWLASLRPVQANPRRPLVALRLLVVVCLDSIKSNFDVARVILGRKKRRDSSGFLSIPLALRDPHGLTLLAIILTSIPGTVCVELTDDKSILVLHVLDLHDEQYWIDTIKTRYEQPLMEIFE